MKYLVRSTLPSLALVAALAACGSASTSPLRTPAAATPTAVVTGASLSPTPLVSPLSEGSTPGNVILGGTWVRPKADATLTSYATTLSARPTASGPGVATFTKVLFWATWAGSKKTVVCTATKPRQGGAWACRANLLARGIAPGTVTFSFDVHGEGAPTASSPGGLRRSTYAVGPPRPTDTALTQIKPPDFDHGSNTGTYLISWSAPTGYADEFLAYYTEDCPRPSTKRNAGKPCFVAGTPVDASQLKLLGTAPADARSMRVRIAESDCEGIYGSILLRARNVYDRSPFAIVQAEQVIWYDPDSTDIIC